jgi:hypothetical protein
MVEAFLAGIEWQKKQDKSDMLLLVCGEPNQGKEYVKMGMAEIDAAYRPGHKWFCIKHNIEDCLICFSKQKKAKRVTKK